MSDSSCCQSCSYGLVNGMFYSSTCHERSPPVRSESGSSWQVATGYRDINTAKTVVGTLQKWPTKAGGQPFTQGSGRGRYYCICFIIQKYGFL